jgi:protein O-GlcNAc transferase
MTATPPSCRNSFAPASSAVTGPIWRQGCLTLRSLSKDYAALTDNPFVTLSFPGVTSEEQRRVAANYARRSIPASVLDAPGPELPAAERTQERRPPAADWLSVGRLPQPPGRPDHAAGHRVARSYSRVEVFGYSMGVDDQSDIRQRSARCLRSFRRSRDCSVTETARAHPCRRDRYPDRSARLDCRWAARGAGPALRAGAGQLAGLCRDDRAPETGRLSSRRPGGDALAHAHCYTETLAHLPNCYLPADSTIALAAPRHGAMPGCRRRASFSVPSTTATSSTRRSSTSGAGCFGERRELSVVEPAGGTAQDRLRSEAQARGVDPARLVFAPRVESRRITCRACNWRIWPSTRFRTTRIRRGSMSCGQACRWSRCLARHFPGRVGASLLHAAGLDELVAASVDEYHELALALARNPQRLGELRSRLANDRHACPLFDMAHFVSSLEEVYCRMWYNKLNSHRQ